MSVCACFSGPLTSPPPTAVVSMIVYTFYLWPTEKHRAGSDDDIAAAISVSVAVDEILFLNFAVYPVYYMSASAWAYRL